jgi:hypothetical protein
MIIQNAVICNKCDDFIFSKTRHDFVSCKCGNIAVDGGQEYLRRVGGIREKTEDGRPSYTDMSWELPNELYRACAIAVKEAEDTGRNHIGMANAVLRKLREADRIIADGEPRILAKGQGMFEDEIMVAEADGTINRYKKVV